jgi:hypothetical protein
MTRAAGTTGQRGQLRPLPKQRVEARGSTEVAFIRKNCISKVVRYSQKLKLIIVFKKFS